ncbi:toxin [Cyanobacteria bacterium FACHB-63]|nr:toxin [Cyanobacteria bacterium FACHB-63]
MNSRESTSSFSPSASVQGRSGGDESDKSYFSPPPAVSLPKGGGAIKGMGEKFAANPVTGTGSMSVPIATSPGRSGFSPQLALSYDSGAGNGIFGMGWSLLLPSITRKTDKGLPRYWDAEDSDIFILSGAEDLVPVLKADGTVDETVRDGYRVRKYRPRIEGLFARIERWSKVDSGEIYWRSISKDNITTLYGKTDESRIADPANPTHVFSWLIRESYDDKGNAIVYRYKSEDSDKSVGINISQAHERNRMPKSRAANRYLKRIQYGNLTPRQPNEDLDQRQDWLFEVVFDYGQHDRTNPIPTEPEQWTAETIRKDPFSSYRAGFEVRTYRLCHRVLVFHHFRGEVGVERDCLVRSTDFTYSDARNPIYSLLKSITQTSYKRNSASGYISESLPPLEFTYSEAILDEMVREVDRASLENLPNGLDGTRYQWVDLDGEGLSGILTEQGNGWFYKRNLSPINTIQDNDKRRVEASFAPVELLASKPASGLGNGMQFLDLAGDGQPDLVTLSGATHGFYERTQDAGWENFVPFKSLPVLDWNNPNLKFIDLNGDGHSDILITEDNCFIWQPSLAEDGFGAAERSPQSWDEEKGPRIIFADSTQSIHLADMSGDGLTDIVRIRNGEVCYWPNLGYGRFGAKVTMDDAPWFDGLDTFNQRRIVLADIDGSGTTDILYLSGEGVQVYFNQSGNSWSAKRVLSSFPATDSVTSVSAFDLLGNGTACLVWSSPLPGSARRAMRYIDLMGSQKPHLLVKTVNNMGAETIVEYAPSTRFYLQDKLAGKPWVTKLPFSVHCVEKVTVTDKWRQTRFSTSYTYHHGYFDGVEREFRGFGRVEQVDVESYGEFANGNSASPYITADKTLYQPPVKTVSWHHTGALLENKRILSQFQHEYFPRWFEDLNPNVVNVLGTFQENDLPEPDLIAQDLSTEEWREALRACKGMLLRQEVYELDVDALEQGKHRLVKLFSTAYHNCHIQRLQAKGSNQHAVFLVTESEAITYHYEMDLRPDNLFPDPRIAHTLNLKFDEYGNVLQSVAVVYPRLGQFEDSTLPADSLALIRQVQRETHLAYTETRYTDDRVPKLVNGVLTNADSYRLRLPCEVLTYELTGINSEDNDDRLSADPRDNRYFTIDELRRFRLSQVHQPSGEAVEEISYHQIPNRNTPQKRLVERARTLFFKDDEAVINNPLPFGQLGQLGLVYENYKLALTEDLLGSVFGVKLTSDERGKLSDAKVSGYLNGTQLATRFPDIDTTGQYWIRSGIAGFEPDAAQHFYLPERYTDPFGNVTTLKYDRRDLYVESSTDMLGNTTSVTEFDFRVLAPREVEDINKNLSEVFFDVLGLPTAMAVKGKGNEGDNLTGFNDALANPALNELTSFFNSPAYDEAQARRWLGNATARHLYYFGEIEETLPDRTTVIRWGQHPACACGIVREQHVSQLAAGEQSPLQASFEYSDGMGSVVVKKVQAEPEKPRQPIRWVANGKTILNNKGKPVKQYEPDFSSVGHRFEEPKEGDTPIIFYYDAPGRTVRTELPDGSYSRVEFSPWHVTSYDPNDTVMEAGNAWFARNSTSAKAEERRAAQLAAAHANTPSLTLLDSLGREVVSIAHNRVKDTAGVLQDEKYLTFTKLDAEGKPLWIRDARKNLVMQYITPPVPDNQLVDPVAGFVPCYDIAGNLLFQHSMDAGDCWMLNDATGKPMLAWTRNNQQTHRFRTEYDALHRPTGSFVGGADLLDADREIQFEKVIYGDTPSNGLSDAAKMQLNLRGKPYQHFDTVGVVVSKGRNPVTGEDEAFDFKGNLLRSTRQLIQNYKTTPDWSQAPTLETEVFSSSTRYDALNRPIQMVAPHSDKLGTKLNVIQPSYNEANLLERVDLWQGQTNEPTALLNPNPATDNIIKNIDYNAKGQRIGIEYGNNSRTAYTYNPQTFRLMRLHTTRTGAFEASPLLLTSSGTLQDLNYVYDPVGNITEIQDAALPVIFNNGERVEPVSLYTYDALYRLIEAKGREHAGQTNYQPTALRDNDRDYPFQNLPNANDMQALRNYTERYLYDPVGNILAMIHSIQNGGWNRAYDYESSNNRLRATSLPGDAAGIYSAKYAYDEHGNMIRMPHFANHANSNQSNMHWDFKDQLHQVDLGGGGTAYSVYGADGQRVRKVVEKSPGLREERIYLGGFEIFRRYNGTGLKLERETLHIMDDQRRIALEETKTFEIKEDGTGGRIDNPKPIIRYQLDNHLGSASLELDKDGNVLSYEEYHPYGTTSYQARSNVAEVSLKRYRYTGKERDEETGFSYHMARYCAVWLGRWISSDPSGIIDGPNTYSYVHENPVRMTDPSGHHAKVDVPTVSIIPFKGSKPSPPEGSSSRGIYSADKRKAAELLKKYPDTQTKFDIDHMRPYVTSPPGSPQKFRLRPSSHAENPHLSPHASTNRSEAGIARTQATQNRQQPDWQDPKSPSYARPIKPKSVKPAGTPPTAEPTQTLTAAAKPAADPVVPKSATTPASAQVNAATSESQAVAKTGLNEAKAVVSVEPTPTLAPATVAESPPITTSISKPPVPPAPSRLARATAWTMEVAPKALKVAGHIATVVGAHNEAVKSAQAVKGSDEDTHKAAYLTTFVFGVVGGTFDDAIGVFNPGFVGNSWETQGAGPTQVLFGEALRSYNAWVQRNGLP